MDNSDLWTVAEGEHNSLPLIIRFKEASASTIKENFPHHVLISWQFDNPTTYGLPIRSESAELEKFEDNLISALTHRKLGGLFGVVTNSNQRNFCLYVNSIEEFVELISGFGRDDGPYPISIEVTRNDEGVWYSRLVKSCDP